MLYARAETPSRISVSRDIQHLLEHARTQLVARLGVRAVDVTVPRVLMLVAVAGSPWQNPPLCGWLDLSKLHVISGSYGALGGGGQPRACHPGLHQVCPDFVKLASYHADTIFFRLNKAHTGVYLAQKLVKSLEEYGIEKKVFSFARTYARQP